MTEQRSIHTTMVRLYAALQDLGYLKSPAGRQSAVARLLNTSPQRVKNWETRGISLEAQFEIQSRFAINATWLGTGDGSMTTASRDESHADEGNAEGLSPSGTVHSHDRPAKSPDKDKGEDMGKALVVSIADHPHADDFVIPQYAAGGAMGHGLVLPEQPGVIERWTVNNEWLEKNVRNYTAKKNLCIVTGFGPSMQPMFNPGDPLLVDTGITRVHADGVYFFRIGDEGYIKQLQKLPKPGGGVIYRAKSANPAYDTFDVDETYDFEVLGKVVRVWCGTDF